MSEERETAMDILPRDMADQFTEFLAEVQSKMAELVEDSNQLARRLDNKDDNKENQDFERLFQTMADSANKIIGVVKEAAEVGIEKLEEKNKNVGSSYQEKLIGQIESDKDALLEQEYTPSQLDGGSGVWISTEEKAQMVTSLQDLMDKWSNYNDALDGKAEDLSHFVPKNELSDICFNMKDKITEIAIGCIETMVKAAERMEAIDKQQQENTEEINKKAKEGIDTVTQEMTQLLREIEGALDL